jgi:hypothetical protein
MSHINIIVTLSNIFGLLPIYTALNKSNHIGLIISLLAVLGSIMQHISERKHNLPGIVFIEYSNVLLNFDRITAITALLYGSYRVYKLHTILSSVLFCKFIIDINILNSVVL